MCLTEHQARKVIKDLVEGEATQEELKVTREIADNLKSALEVQKAITNDLQQQYGNMMMIYDEQDYQISLMEYSIKEQEESLKKANRRSTFYKITTAAALIGAGALLIAK